MQHEMTFSGRPMDGLGHNNALDDSSSRPQPHGYHDTRLLPGLVATTIKPCLMSSRVYWMLPSELMLTVESYLYNHREDLFSGILIM